MIDPALSPAITQLTDFVLRTSDGAVIDRPRDLTLGPPPPTVVQESAPGSCTAAPPAWSVVQWAVSWYENAAEPEGFSSVVWPQSTPRGLMLPRHSATGDVIEFGLAYQDATGVLLPASIVRWFGWLNYGTTRALVVKGRYPTLIAAARDAATIIDMVCLNEIDPTRSFDLTAPDAAELDLEDFEDDL